MSLDLLLQKEDTIPEFDDYTSTVAEMASFENRWRESKRWNIVPCSLDFLNYMDTLVLKSGIPVGSVEFVSATLGRIFNVNPKQTPLIQPLNVPVALDDPYYSGRRIARGVEVKDLSETVKRLSGAHGRAFVKSDSRLKVDGITGVYNKNYNFRFPETDKYFVSEVFRAPISAEWRIFVYDDLVLDIRRYEGDYYTAPPKKDWVKKAVEALRTGKETPPPAYTLDVAVLENGEEAVVEVHPFIACGLYGFEHTYLLDMLRDAWRWQIKKTENLLKGG